MNRYISALVIIAATSQPFPNKAWSYEESEIEQLIQAIESSECTFIRNGKRYSSTKAARLMRYKLKRAKDSIINAEDFIAKIATKSSTSQKPYKIDCEGSEVNTGAQWLEWQLLALRTHTKQASQVIVLES